jgi:hypothetical protein
MRQIVRFGVLSHLTGHFGAARKAILAVVEAELVRTGIYLAVVWRTYSQVRIISHLFWPSQCERSASPMPRDAMA